MVWTYHLQCFECHSPQPVDGWGLRCDRCQGLLEVKFELSERRRIPWKARSLSVWKYREVLPVEDDLAITTLGEGGTGLHRCSRLGRSLGLKKLYVKNEGENPTGSFKDRGMTVALSKACELGRRKMICASTGNTAASLAAYSARAGLACFVFVPLGQVARGKMLQVIIHGAKIVQVKGDFDQTLETVMKICEEHKDLHLMNSLNPFRLEGQKTLGYEILDQLSGQAPDTVILPVGNGGNISAVWKSFSELRELNLARQTPRMIGIQAAGAAPIARAIKLQHDRIRPVSKPKTLASAIQIGAPVNWPKVLSAIKDSSGTARTVSDREILQSQSDLAEQEGIFVEPSSAASIAGLKRLLEDGGVDRTDTVVCVTTGHGLKDPSAVDRHPYSGREVTVDPADPGGLDAILRRIL